jgi:hypothetical protein
MASCRPRTRIWLLTLCLFLGGCTSSTATPTGPLEPTSTPPPGTAAPGRPEISIDGTYYRASTQVAGVLERVSDDKGGVLQVFLRNTGEDEAVVADLVLDGRKAAALEKSGVLSWWRVWPEKIPAGGTAVLTLHAKGGPLAAGRTLQLTVTGKDFSASASTLLDEPPLRISYVVRGDDASSLLVFVRNDSNDATFDIQGLSNGTVPLPFTFRSGSGVVLPGTLSLLDVHRDAPFGRLEPLSLRLDARNDSTQAAVSIGSSLRLVEPYFPIGTWGSCAWDYASPDLLVMRSLGIGSVVGSLKSRPRISPYEFGMRSLDFTGDPPTIDLMNILLRRDDPDVAAIMLKDEPEWSDNMDSADVSAAQTSAARATKTIATYLNLCVSKRFSKYAVIADIASMDHYAYYAPLANDLPIPHKVAEAGWYMESLKGQAEPRPVWAWTQYAGWDRDPPAWSVENQAWQVLAEGAKGLYWFSYGKGFRDEYPEQTAALERVDRQIELVKGVLLRGDPYRGGVDVEGSGALLARVVAGRDSAVVVLVNRDDRAALGLDGFTFTLRSQAEVVCDIAMPSWISDGPVFEVTPEGLLPTAWAAVDGRLRLTTGLANTRVFLVGPPDGQAPAAPKKLRRIAWLDGTEWLGWQEAEDATGILSYEVLADGKPVATVRSPIWHVPSGSAAAADFTVRATDAFGRVGPESEVATPVR